LTGIDLEDMKESLMNSEYLKEINLENNNFDDVDCLILNDILKVSKIEKINLSHNGFTGFGLEKMKESLMNTKYLKEIDLKASQFDDNDYSILNDILKVSKIEKINLSCKQFFKRKLMILLELD
jgi:hypothetical protein